MGREGCFAVRPGAGLSAHVSATQMVKPSAASRGPQTATPVLKMDVLDAVTAPIMIIHLPFLYAHRLDPASLATSLAATLHHFPMFAGRVRTSAAGDFEVALSGAGASLAVAASTADMADLLPSTAVVPPFSGEGGPGPTSVGIANGASYDSSTSDSSADAGECFSPVDLAPFYPDCPHTLLGFLNKDVPLLHAQATHLADGATCLAVSIPHLLGDLDTCKTFMSAWAAAYSACTAGKDPAAALAALPPAEHNPLQRFAADSVPEGYESRHFERRSWTFVPKVVGGALWHIAAAGGCETVAYHVPAARLAALKDEASAGGVGATPPPSPPSAGSSGAAGGALPNPPCAWISTNDALVARLWQALGSLPAKKKFRLYLSLNLRKRLPGLAPAALGNCAWSVPVGNGAEVHDKSRCTPGSGQQGGDFPPQCAPLSELAGKVRASIQGLDVQEVRQELKWLHNQQATGKTMPVVIKGVLSMLPPAGNVVVSNWSWDAGYESVAFAGSASACGDAISAGSGPSGQMSAACAAPVWHRPMQTRGPNTCFILPAPPALPGGGSVVFITLHKQLAAQLQAAWPAL